MWAKIERLHHGRLDFPTRQKKPGFTTNNRHSLVFYSASDFSENFSLGGHSHLLVLQDNLALGPSMKEYLVGLSNGMEFPKAEIPNLVPPDVRRPRNRGRRN